MEFIKSRWLYIPFNFRQEGRIKQLMDNLRSQFGRVISEDDLEMLWRKGNNSDCDKIKRAYKNVSGSLNTNSMTLFSGEIDYRLSQYLPNNCSKYYCFWKCEYNYKPSGCLYMGDYDASGSQKWDQLKNAYDKYWDHIGCVQILHHGSRHNFDSFFVISAGLTNRYRHPHTSVMKSFLLNHIMPYVVTEQIGSAFYTDVKCI